MYVFQPRSLVMVGLANEKIHQVKDFLQGHKDMPRVAHDNFCQAQDHYKKYANAHRRQVIFNEGDMVFFRLPKKSRSLKAGPSPKLLPQFCQVLRR